MTNDVSVSHATALLVRRWEEGSKEAVHKLLSTMDEDMIRSIAGVAYYIWEAANEQLRT